MDIFSHGLYGGLAFGRRSRRDYLIAFLFGIAPDLVTFGPFFIMGLFSDSLSGQPDLAMIPPYIFAVYNVTHSLVIYALIFVLLWWLGKKHLAKLTLAWPLHILVDIPTHDRNFFPTPFLWPFSDLSVNGIPWAHPIIFIPNVIILVLLYAYWYLQRKKMRNQVNQKSPVKNNF